MADIKVEGKGSLYRPNGNKAGRKTENKTGMTGEKYRVNKTILSAVQHRLALTKRTI